MIKLTPYSFRLQLKNNGIFLISDFRTKNTVTSFSYPLTSKQAKIYILVDGKNILYIGTTTSSIKNRLRSGLKADGLNGYHGYKWKGQKNVGLFVWCFEDLNKVQIENIEAELAFIVRKTTGKWPLYQNEIHFNNDYSTTGNLIATKLLRQIQTITQ